MSPLGVGLALTAALLLGVLVAWPDRCRVCSRYVAPGKAYCSGHDK